VDQKCGEKSSLAKNEMFQNTRQHSKFPPQNIFPPNFIFLKKSKSYFFLKLPKFESDFENYIFSKKI